jgi:5-methylcytosine-specific restriction endonuclease McrA
MVKFITPKDGSGIIVVHHNVDIGVIKGTRQPVFHSNGMVLSLDEMEKILKKMRGQLPPKGMIRLRKVTLKEVIGDKPHCKIWANKKLHTISLHSERMALLIRTQVCACCGLKGTHFWLEYSGCKAPHLNLYGNNGNGKEVMLTADHIIPRSKGGPTAAHNLQILCARCNCAKKSDCISLDELRKRRGI